MPALANLRLSRSSDVTIDEARQIPTITIREDADQGRRLKTAGSARVVPVHPELVRIGFLRFVEQAKSAGGKGARLFPLLTPGPKGGFGEAWSKWFGRYIRDLGITNKASVFHSFRHGFKDALRAAEVSEDVNDALTGHSGGGSVGRTYGSKAMLRRFGLPALGSSGIQSGVSRARHFRAELQAIGQCQPPPKCTWDGEKSYGHSRIISSCYGGSWNTLS